MKPSNAITLLAAASGAVATRVSYDTTYDNRDAGLTSVACSDGTNGLITKYGWQTFGNIDDRLSATSYIGGSSDISGWNSAECGQCYQVDYNGKSIHVLAVDHADLGLNIAQSGLDDLTNGNAVNFGAVDATVTKVDVSNCLTSSSKREIAFKA